MKWLFEDSKYENYHYKTDPLVRNLESVVANKQLENIKAGSFKKLYVHLYCKPTFK